MVKWQRQFALEWNHIFRNVWFMGLPVLYGIFYAWFLSASPPLKNLFAETYNFHSLVHTLTLGIAMLLGILAIRRDIRRPSYEWSAGLPVSYSTRITAKYAAGMTYLTLFSLLAAGLFILFSAKRGIESGITVSHSVYFGLSYEISYMVTLALAMLLAVCLPNRVVYLIGFCAWMFGTFFMQLFIVERNDWYMLSIFHLSQLFVQGTRGGELWGYQLIADELLLSGLFVLAFAALLLVAANTILNRLRPTKHGLRLGVTAGLSVLIACAAFVPYGLLWQERYSSYYDKINDDTLLEFTELRNEQKEKSFEVANYDLMLEKTKNDVLTVTARLEIPAASLKASLKEKEEITFTLNRAFTVSGVEADGRILPYKQQGDSLSVTWGEPMEQPADRIFVEVRYSGAVREYGGRGQFYAFAHQGLVMLPSYFAWYPLPGKQSVYAKDDWSERLQLSAIFYEMSYPNAAYRLTAKGFDTKLYTSLPEVEPSANDNLQRTDGRPQVFQGTGKDGISLFGGTLVEVSHPSLPSRVITTPNSKGYAEQLLEEWNGYYDYFVSWVADFKPRINQVNYFVTEHSLPVTTENGTYIYISSGGVDYGLASFFMNEMLLGTRRGSYQIEKTRDDIRMPLRSLMWYVYYNEVDGFSHKDMENGMADFRMLGALFHHDPDQDPENLGGRMAKQVGQALDKGKTKEVKEVLNYFYSQGLDVPIEDSSAPAKGRPIPYEAWEREWERVIGHES